jgi:hypothetical protein
MLGVPDVLDVVGITFGTCRLDDKRRPRCRWVCLPHSVSCSTARNADDLSSISQQSGASCTSCQLTAGPSDGSTCTGCKLLTFNAHDLAIFDCRGDRPEQSKVAVQLRMIPASLGDQNSRNGIPTNGRRTGWCGLVRMSHVSGSKPALTS